MQCLKIITIKIHTIMAEVTRKGFKDKNGNKVSLIAKVINAITGHFAGLNNKGEVVDSGYGPSDFAEASHTHGSISDFAGTDGVGASVEVGEDHETQGLGVVKITVKGDGRETDSESVTIHYNNIGNLIRALTAPDSTIQNNDKLALASAVYAALSKKTDLHDGEGNYDSIIRVGKVNRDDDELDGAIINGKSVIRITVNGVSVYVDPTNLANLQRALLPAAPPAPNGTSPITNGQVYTALHELSTALPVVSLNFSSQYGWSVVNSGDALNLLSENNKVVMVEVRCSVEVSSDETVNFRSIGNIFANNTQNSDVEVGLVVDGRMFIFVNNVQDWRDLNGEYYDDDTQDCTLTSTNLYPSN